jgi:hypothetical protein
MPEFFHGTRSDFAKTIVGGGIDVSKGSGEFGCGFYTQCGRTDAWSWAIARWGDKGEAAVVRLDVTEAEWDGLKKKGPLTHKKSNELRATAKKQGQSKYVCGTDVVIGTIQNRPKKEQQKFESSRSENELNSPRTARAFDEIT